MSILVDKNARVIIHGFTGKEGSFHGEQCIAYGTNIVGGVTPGKGGSMHLGRPTFNRAIDAARETEADTSLIFVPPAYAADSIMEAADAGIKLIVAITEGIPVSDMVKAKAFIVKKGVKLIGPNCPGVITPNEAKIGIMPGNVFKRGAIGLISKSGTLTYEAANQIAKVGLGVSTAVGIGGDPIVGLDYTDLLKLFEADDETKAIALIGEIGGDLEIQAARFIAKNSTKPVIAFIAGQTAPKGKRMGHAGAIVSGGAGTAQEKMDALDRAGAIVVKSPSDIGATIKAALAQKA
ncbi:MAG: succinate--CoA ligase subunit alpha [Helicobacteraceae bacterium]|jgi:succinyl-CoA synthetase alpha subunit|nr:succinate--CoA ligase subunit alpha [Helicobacteraceae bacterium]